MHPWLRKRVPVSAWLISIGYMITMQASDTGDGRLVGIWFWTAIPLFWAWTLTMWQIQKRRGPKRAADFQT